MAAQSAEARYRTGIDTIYNGETADRHVVGMRFRTTTTDDSTGIRFTLSARHKRSQAVKLSLLCQSTYSLVAFV
jgi:hypothetical protein